MSTRIIIEKDGKRYVPYGLFEHWFSDDMTAMGLSNDGEEVEFAIRPIDTDPRDETVDKLIGALESMVRMRCETCTLKYESMCPVCVVENNVKPVLKEAKGGEK